MSLPFLLPKSSPPPVITTSLLMYSAVPNIFLTASFPHTLAPFKFFGLYSHYQQNIHTHWYLETKYSYETEHELFVPLHFDYLTYYYYFQYYPVSYRFYNFIFLYGCVKFHCVCAANFPYLFICW